MHSTLHLLALSILSSSLCTASPTAYDTPPSDKLVMGYHEIDLEAYEKTGETGLALSERRKVKICGFEFHVTGMGCITLAGVGVSMGLGIGNLVDKMSKQRTCSPQEFDNINYQYAVRAKGNCHTTAQRDTIQGAILHYLNENFNESTCGVQCMKLTHGAQWEGYVVFGKPNYDWSYYLDKCSDISKLGHCEKGGKKYVHELEL